MLDDALDYARKGWALLPLRGKVPLTRHGVRDATSDAGQLRSWWEAWPTANIGAAVHPRLVVIDVDPRNGGAESWAGLEAEHGEFPPTVTVRSGRNDGGCHRYVLAPEGQRITAGKLPPGIDLKRHGGYVLLPPSLHPDTGLPYAWEEEGPSVPAKMPDWFVALVVARHEHDPVHRSGWLDNRPRAAGSIADAFSSSATWDEVLGPHGWALVGGDGDADGSQWAHPNASTDHSASVRHGCLFVYSSNTPFDMTTDNEPHGYTRFAAYATLNHGGNMTQAARALMRRDES